MISDNSDKDEQNEDENEQNELSEKENNGNVGHLLIPRSSTRNKKSPVRYPETTNVNNVYVNFCKINTPCNFEEASYCDENKYWKKAMDTEIDSLNKNITWELVENVENKDVLDSQL